MALSLEISVARASQLETSARERVRPAAEALESFTDRTRGAAEGALMLQLFARRLGYFYLRDELGLDEPTLARVASRHGPILGLRRETLAAKGALLSRRLGLTADDGRLRALVAKQPSVLGHSVATLELKLAWIEEAYALSTAELGDVVVGNPSLLSASVNDALRPARAALADLGDAALARKVALGAPQCLRARALYLADTASLFFTSQYISMCGHHFSDLGILKTKSGCRLVCRAFRRSRELTRSRACLAWLSRKTLRLSCV